MLRVCSQKSQKEQKKPIELFKQEETINMENCLKRTKEQQEQIPVMNNSFINESLMKSGQHTRTNSHYQTNYCLELFKGLDPLPKSNMKSISKDLEDQKSDLDYLCKAYQDSCYKRADSTNRSRLESQRSKIVSPFSRNQDLADIGVENEYQTQQYKLNISKSKRNISGTYHL